MNGGIVEKDEIEREHRDDIQAHNAHCQHVSCDSSLGKALEETGTHLQADAIDKEDEAEVLHVVQHRRSTRETDVSGKNARKEYKGDAQRDAENLETAEGDTHGDDQRIENHDMGY